MAIKLSITEAKAKLNKVNLAVKHLTESKVPLDTRRKKLAQLKEARASLTTLLREEVREYTPQESEAVGKELLKTLKIAIRGTKGEFASEPEVTGHKNGFNIHAVYGRDKGEDTFKFELAPPPAEPKPLEGEPEKTGKTGMIKLKSGKEDEDVAPFEVTEANQVNINKTVDLEKVLRDLLTKYIPEPTDQDYDAQAEMEPPHDESQINKFIAERKSKLRKKFLTENLEVTDVKIEDSTPKIKSETMKEDLDIGHEDNEPNMVKGDLYKIIRNAVDLYKAMQALEGQGEVDFPQWWQGKIIRASDDIECAKEYLEFEMEEPAIDAVLTTLGEESEIVKVDTKTLKNVKLKNGKTYANVRFHLPNDPKSFVTADDGYMINQDIQSIVDADQELKEIAFDIAGLGTYRSTKQDADTITGVDNAGTVKTFSKRKIEQDNPGIFDRKPREKKPQGVRPYTESQYRKILQGAIDNAGSTKFAYDIADSMILDNQILARLAKDYPEAGARELKQRLQWDLEACDSPKDDYDENYEGEVAKTALNEKKATYCGGCKTTHVKGTSCPTKKVNEDFDVSKIKVKDTVELKNSRTGNTGKYTVKRILGGSSDIKEIEVLNSSNQPLNLYYSKERGLQNFKGDVYEYIPESNLDEAVDEKSRIKALKAKITGITGDKNPSDPTKVTYKGESYLKFRDRKEEPATTAVYYVDVNDKVFKVNNGELKQIS